MIFSKLPKESMPHKNPSEWSGWDLNSGQLSLELVFFFILIKSCHLILLHQDKFCIKVYGREGRRHFLNVHVFLLHNIVLSLLILPSPHSSHHYMFWTW